MNGYIGVEYPSSIISPPTATTSSPRFHYAPAFPPACGVVLVIFVDTIHDQRSRIIDQEQETQLSGFQRQLSKGPPVLDPQSVHGFRIKLSAVLREESGGATILQ